MISLRRLPQQVISCLILAQLQACGPAVEQGTTGSQPSVTDVAHTIAKRQSIGNCWLYATGTWLESMILTYQHQEVDVSESYWTWWHFYNQIIQAPGLVKEVDTGGGWNIARTIMLKHGFIAEGDFIPGERGVEMSFQQRRALYTINDALQYGELKDPAARTPEKVRAVRDAAFGSNMAEAEAKATMPANQPLYTKPDGTKISLKQILDYRSREAWTEQAFPRVFGETTAVDTQTENARRRLWKRVFRALNDKQPVVISVMIDFNALDNLDGTFKGQRLRETGVGDQGGHMTVLEDYTVSEVPGVGTIGRGMVSPDLQAKAIEGRLEQLVVKNSWGVDRPERGIKDGITYFDRSYLEGQFPWKLDEDNPDTELDWYTTMTSVVLPAGY